MTGVRRRRGDLIAAAVRLARLLGPDECVLIGGLAVGVQGYVRATDDLDFICRRPLEETRARLRQVGIEARLLRGDAFDAGFSCLKGEIDGVRFDILPPLVPIAWDRALKTELRGGRVNVVDLDGLLRLKFRSGGPQDLLDATRLILRHPEVEARGRELAVAHGTLDPLEHWLRDPRMRAQAREAASAEARRRRKAPRGRESPRKKGKRTS